MKNMTLEQAREIATKVAATRIKWGKQGVAPYTVDQLCEAMAVLKQIGDFDPVAEAELTKLRRQLAAANARVAKLSKAGSTD